MDREDTMDESARTARHDSLRRVLEERRRTIVADLRQGIRESCDGDAVDRADGVLDAADIGELACQDEIRFALIDMKAETLVRIDDALSRLADGRYGSCDDCGSDIPEARLRAMPFAVRCLRCQESREHEVRDHRRSERLMDRLHFENPKEP